MLNFQCDRRGEKSVATAASNDRKKHRAKGLRKEAQSCGKIWGQTEMKLQVGFKWTWGAWKRSSDVEEIPFNLRWISLWKINLKGQSCRQSYYFITRAVSYSVMDICMLCAGLKPNQKTNPLLGDSILKKLQVLWTVSFQAACKCVYFSTRLGQVSFLGHSIKHVPKTNFLECVHIVPLFHSSYVIWIYLI